MSLSARRAWIEITAVLAGVLSLLSRSPQGERGLKYARLQGHAGPWPSLSARRAWIEIEAILEAANFASSRSPQGERGLKSAGGTALPLQLPSLSARRAWIEIPLTRRTRHLSAVALRKESVD